MSPSRPIPWGPLSILSGGKCNPRLTRPLPAPRGPYPGSTPPTPLPIHFLTANSWDYEEKCCSTRRDTTFHVLGTEITMRKVTECDSGHNPANTLTAGPLNVWGRGGVDPGAKNNLCDAAVMRFRGTEEQIKESEMAIIKRVFALTSGYSLTGTNSFSCRWTMAPTGSGSSRGGLSTRPFTVSLYMSLRTLLISERHQCNHVRLTLVWVCFRYEHLEPGANY